MEPAGDARRKRSGDPIYFYNATRQIMHRSYPVHGCVVEIFRWGVTNVKQDKKILVEKQRAKLNSLIHDRGFFDSQILDQSKVVDSIVIKFMRAKKC
jgi:hypothetical protein